MATLFWIIVIFWFIVLPVWRAIQKGAQQAQQPVDPNQPTQEELKAAAARLNPSMQDLMQRDFIEKVRAEALRYRAEQQPAAEVPLEETRYVASGAVEAEGERYGNEGGQARFPIPAEGSLSSAETFAEPESLESQLAVKGEYQMLYTDPDELLTEEEQAVLRKYTNQGAMEAPSAEEGKAVFGWKSFEEEEAHFGEVAPRKRNEKAVKLRKAARSPESLKQAMILKEILNRPSYL